MAKKKYRNLHALLAAEKRGESVRPVFKGRGRTLASKLASSIKPPTEAQRGLLKAARAKGGFWETGTSRGRTLGSKLKEQIMANPPKGPKPPPMKAEMWASGLVRGGGGSKAKGSTGGSIYVKEHMRNGRKVAAHYRKRR